MSAEQPHASDHAWLAERPGANRFWFDGLSDWQLHLRVHRGISRMGIAVQKADSSIGDQVFLPAAELRNLAAYFTQIADELELTGGSA